MAFVYESASFVAGLMPWSGRARHAVCDRMRVTRVVDDRRERLELRKWLDAEIRVLDEADQEVGMLTVLEDACRGLSGEGRRAVVLVVVRHYGCPLCEQLLRSVKAELEDLDGVTLLVLGSGTPKQARIVKDVVKFPGRILSDPERRAYRALGMRAGVWTTFNADGLQSAIQSVQSGNRIRLELIPTDPFQQGGMLVLDDTARVALLHQDEFAGDHVNMAVMRKVVDALRNELEDVDAMKLSSES